MASSRSLEHAKFTMCTDPWVTAIMPTRGRADLLPAAIDCFLSQTYAHRNLIILDDDHDTPDWENDAHGIEHHRLGTVYGIGFKRNVACSRARGEIIMHWDDDDWSHPGRMADQVELMIESGMPVVGYHSMPFTDGRSWWMYDGGPGRAIGTSLAYLRDYWMHHPFPDVRTGEDIAFVTAAQPRVATRPAGGMMYATNHARNTSPRVTNTKQWRRIDQPLCA